MALPFGINLRVTANSNQGGRKYMEDTFAVAYQKTPDEKDLEFAYFGIFDGHGGREAAVFAQDHLLDNIADQKGFWSDNDDSVLKAIKDGFIATHHAMWKELGKWPKTVTGLPSTSGTTASIVFIRRGKLFIGHVGDSGIVLGLRESGSDHFTALPLTKDHKPECPTERKRIEKLGGSVISKSGVQRVVWNRPKLGHKGPVRRSTRIDQIPFLAVARSLGDLWSYDFYHGDFVVSPEPDVRVVEIDLKRFRCMILASDGLWNMISPQEAVHAVEEVERREEQQIWGDVHNNNNTKVHKPLNPSKLLVKKALALWNVQKMRADNTTVVTVMIDPQGPSRCEVLIRHRTMKRLRSRGSSDTSMYFLTDPDSSISSQSICKSEVSDRQMYKTISKKSDCLKKKMDILHSCGGSFDLPNKDHSDSFSSKSAWKNDIVSKRRCYEHFVPTPIKRSSLIENVDKSDSKSFDWKIYNDNSNNNGISNNNNNNNVYNTNINNVHNNISSKFKVDNKSEIEGSSLLSFPRNGIGKVIPQLQKSPDYSNTELGKVSCPRKILDDMCTNIKMYNNVNFNTEDSSEEDGVETSCESCLDRQVCENTHLGISEDSHHCTNSNTGLKTSYKLTANSRLIEAESDSQNKCCTCKDIVVVPPSQKKLSSNTHLIKNSNSNLVLPCEDLPVSSKIGETPPPGLVLRNKRISFTTKDLKSHSKHHKRLNLLLKRKSVVKEISHSLTEQQQKYTNLKHSPSSYHKVENCYTCDNTFLKLDTNPSKILLSHVKSNRKRKICHEKICNLRKKGHA